MAERQVGDNFISEQQEVFIKIESKESAVKKRLNEIAGYLFKNKYYKGSGIIAATVENKGLAKKTLKKLKKQIAHPQSDIDLGSSVYEYGMISALLGITDQATVAMEHCFSRVHGAGTAGAIAAEINDTESVKEAINQLSPTSLDAGTLSAKLSRITGDTQDVTKKAEELFGMQKFEIAAYITALSGNKDFSIKAIDAALYDRAEKGYLNSIAGEAAAIIDDAQRAGKIIDLLIKKGNLTGAVKVAGAMGDMQKMDEIIEVIPETDRIYALSIAGIRLANFYSRRLRK